MLSIVFGDIENSIFHPPTYFDNQYEDEWITNPLSVEMIKDIDKSEVVSAHLIEKHFPNTLWWRFSKRHSNTGKYCCLYWEMKHNVQNFSRRR